mgnify:CR=1 FL=1
MTAKARWSPPERSPDQLPQPALRPQPVHPQKPQRRQESRQGVPEGKESAMIHCWTQEEIAAQIGMVGEALARTLRAFANAGLLKGLSML